jgi:hypothetical protein
VISITVKHNIDDAIRRLRAQAKQVPFAIAKALTDTARDAARDVQANLPDVIASPTPFTRNSIRWQRATKQTLTSAVYIAPIAASYLRPLITGETVTPRKGRALVLPGADKLNAYGNVPRTRLKTLLRNPKNFAGTVKGIGGIWQRQGRNVRLLLRFEPEQRKRVSFPFGRMVEESVRRRFAANFKAAFDYAMRTAR